MGLEKLAASVLFDYRFDSWFPFLKEELLTVVLRKEKYLSKFCKSLVNPVNASLQPCKLLN